jgi:hypothetical protein
MSERPFGMAGVAGKAGECIDLGLRFPPRHVTPLTVRVVRSVRLPPVPSCAPRFSGRPRIPARPPLHIEPLRASQRFPTLFLAFRRWRVNRRSGFDVTCERESAGAQELRASLTPTRAPWAWERGPKIRRYPSDFSYIGPRVYPSAQRGAKSRSPWVPSLSYSEEPGPICSRSPRDFSHIGPGGGHPYLEGGRSTRSRPLRVPRLGASAHTSSPWSFWPKSDSTLNDLGVNCGNHPSISAVPAASVP